ncbi:MAG: carboxyl-terminal processing protease, partial [Pirellulaceae bacterium]
MRQSFLNRAGNYLTRPIVVLSGIAIGLATFMAAQAIPGPKPADRQVSLVVSSLLRREHLSKRALDDEVSQRALKTFLRSLDPMKLYFVQGDIDEFALQDKEIDDMVKKGDLKFGHTIFNRLLQRVDERVKMIDEILKEDHDFNVDEEMVTEPDMLAHPKDPTEAKERWRKRIKYDLLVLKSDKTEGQEARDKLSRRYHSFAKRMNQTDSDDLLEMFLTAFTTGFDPHTTYMSASSYDDFIIMMRLNLEGIGAALQVDDGYTVVTKVIPGGAASKHGKLKPEDKIIAVGTTEDAEMVDVVDMKLRDVVKMIRGKSGTKVRLRVLPAGGATEAVTYTIVRARVELKDSEAQGKIFEEGQKPNGSPFKFGVIDLPSFYMDMDAARLGKLDYKSTTRDVAKILEGFKKEGIDAVVLDLRKNGGGSLTEAIDLTGLFIDKGPVVQVKDSAGRVQHYDDRNAGLAWDGPLVVLTSKFSASASEILAGAIQDYDRGLVVGDEATHGKGTVQSLLNLGSQLFSNLPNPPNLGALKITMQQFYRPNGHSTQKRGVLADVPLPSITTHMDVAEGDLDYALEFDQIPEASYTKYSMTNSDMIVKLKQRSQAR